MKRILVTTAAAMMLSASAFASDVDNGFLGYDQQQASDIFASDFIGMRVYATEQGYDSLGAEATVADADISTWDDVGQVNDIRVGRNGEVKAVILGVGGFLGVGEKDVAVPMESLKFAHDEQDDRFLVVKTNRVALTDAPDYEKQLDEWMASVKETGDSIAKEANQLAASAGASMKDAKDSLVVYGSKAKAELVDAGKEAKQKTMSVVNGTKADLAETAEGLHADSDISGPATLTVADLQGQRVYSVKNEDIGEVDGLILDASGKIDNAVLDIGGFVGMGEHRVIVPIERLDIRHASDSETTKVYINATQEELEAQPQYLGS